MNIGERIKALRIEKNLTQAELAEKLHTTKQNIFKYETSIVSNIPLHRIEQLANVLNCSPAYLMGWEEKVANNLETTTKAEKDLLNKYRKLNTIGKAKADEYIGDLSEQPKYTAESGNVSADIAQELSQELHTAPHTTSTK